MSAGLRIEAVVSDADGERIVSASGQTAKALLELVRSHRHGLTALECGAWAFRLAAYVYLLRRDYGLAVETIREPHSTEHGGSGFHARYRLASRVRISNVTESAQ